MALSNLQLTPQFVQAVRDAADIVEIAGTHTKLQRAGRKYKGLCPFHKEKTPSFHVDPDQGLYYCFGCGKGGDAIKLHMETTGDDFPAAMEALARRFGVPLPAPVQRRTSGAGASDARDLEPVLEAAAEYFAGELVRSAVARRYLKERRIPEELAKRYALGYAPEGWRNLIGALHPRFSLADLLDAGLVARPEGGGEPYDRFRHRLVFPIKNAAGRLLGFGGRTLGDDKAKYVNTAETERFHKGSILFGLDLAKRALRDSGRAFLVEGYFDQLAAVASGIEGAVASMGTALTPEQAKLLARYAEEVVVGYDGDPAGETAARRALPILLAEGLTVRRARFGEGHDPDSLRLAQGEAALQAAWEKAEDLILLELERLVPADAHRSPHRRAKAAKEATGLLAPVRDAVLRYSYGRIAADRLGVPAHLLWQRLGVGKEALLEGAGVAPGRREVQSLEEEALQLLWLVEEGRPGPEELPSEEIFYDPDLRNIFALWTALYRQQGAPPTPRELLAAGQDRPELLDRIAKLLLEEGFAPRRGRLSEALNELNRRWQRQRLKHLAAEIREAERRGEIALRDRLVEEKQLLSRALHALPGSPGAGGRQ